MQGDSHSDASWLQVLERAPSEPASLTPGLTWQPLSTGVRGPLRDWLLRCVHRELAVPGPRSYSLQGPGRGRAQVNGALSRGCMVRR